jgi:hypothetical protein
MGGLPKVPPDWDDDSFYQRVQRAMTPRAEFDKEATVLGPIEPERFAANTGPAKIYFQWAQHDMYISRKSADEYFNAVRGPSNRSGTSPATSSTMRNRSPIVVRGCSTLWE